MKHLVLLHQALLFLSLCLIPLSGFARNDDVTLYGYVVDSPMNTPINNASVTVLNAADSSYVTVAMSDLGSGTVTGDEKVDYTYTGGFRVRLPRGKYILSVSCLGYEPTVVNVDLTTLGKRFAMFGEDLLVAFRELEALIANYPARGVKGAVGTQLDLLTLFDHDLAKVAEFDARVRRHLGIPHTFNATGQVYPRSLDFATVATLVHIGAGASSFAKTLRLMAGHELAGEGFLPGQVGSSAMPHKMNSRSCERLNGLHVILKGYLSMTAALAGDQWNEGDVSCSVVRRVALPDSFFAIDALLETFLVILNQMEINVPVIEREKNHYLPFLLTTTIMMEAVKRGVGRETAHEVIKEHAVAASRDLRQGKISRNDLFDRLAADGRLKLSRADFDAISAAASAETGTAGMQTDAFVAAARELSAKYPAAAEIRPGAIL